MKYLILLACVCLASSLPREKRHFGMMRHGGGHHGWGGGHGGWGHGHHAGWGGHHGWGWGAHKQVNTGGQIGLTGGSSSQTTHVNAGGQSDKTIIVLQPPVNTGYVQTTHLQRPVQVVQKRPVSTGGKIVQQVVEEDQNIYGEEDPDFLEQQTIVHESSFNPVKTLRSVGAVVPVPV